jgi:pimeloyl-ACP methyl ester carboxylesterase
MTTKIFAALAAPLALMALSPALGETPAAASAHSDSKAMGHISIEQAGSGPAVILIPGLSSPRAVYDGIVPELARTHTVYTVQVNGFAGEDPAQNLQPGILDGTVEDLHRFIADNALKAPRVIGHSMGGLLGLMLARAHPEDVGALMVVDALPYVGDIFVPGATVAQVEPQAKAMRDAMAGAYGKPADTATAAAIAASQALKPESRTTVAGYIAQADPRVAAQAMYEDMTTDLRPAMAAIETPVTLVYPWSAAMPQERADAFYRAEYAGAPHVAFVPVADSGHFVMLDQPQAFAAAVEAFLAAK